MIDSGYYLLITCYFINLTLIGFGVWLIIVFEQFIHFKFHIKMSICISSRIPPSPIGRFEAAFKKSM